MQIQPANISRSIKATLLSCALVLLTLSAPSARAANKDMIQLQVQVQQLQDAVARLQQSNDERMGVMKDLVQQSADSVNKMSATIDAVQLQIKNQQEAQGTKIDQVSGQIQSLNDSIDEVKARLGRLEKIMQDVQSQQQSMSANMQGSPAAGSALPSGTESPMTAAPQPPTDPTPAPAGRKGKPSAGIPLAAAPAASPAPPVDDLYKTALGDYMSAKYTLADSEFGDVIRYYPDNPLAGNAYYYQAEIAYRGGHYDDAIKAYDNVITKYPASNKVPVSRLHKGQALIALKQKDAGVRELRGLIQRFPTSPEAMQARSRLSGMGVPVTPRR
jgi:tol-pal system protein YbgF